MAAVVNTRFKKAKEVKDIGFLRHLLQIHAILTPFAICMEGMVYQTYRMDDAFTSTFVFGCIMFFVFLRLAFGSLGRKKLEGALSGKNDKV